MDTHLDLLDVRKSNIRNAGVGCFAKTMIPHGTLMGPYKGRYMNRKQRNRLSNGTFIWKINDDRYVDGIDHRENNPLRYVNGAKTKIQKSKINCIVKMIGSSPQNEKVFYMATKDIKPNEELIISYGSTYFNFPH